MKRPTRLALRRAIASYERAVSLDSTFAQAWSAALPCPARHSTPTACPDPGLARAGAGSRRSGLAPCEPDDPLAAPARSATSSGRVNPADNRRAAAEYDARASAGARQRGPVRARSRRPRRCIGRVGTALRARLARASLLDPRSAAAARRLAAVHICAPAVSPRRTRPPTARSALAPSSPAMVSLQGHGRCRPGRPRQRPRGDPRGRGTHRSRHALPLHRQLPGHRTGCSTSRSGGRCSRLPPAAFDDDRGSWGLGAGPASTSSAATGGGWRSTPTRRGWRCEEQIAGRAGRRAAPGAPRAGARAIWGGNRRRSGEGLRGAGAHAGRPGRVLRAVQPASAGADLPGDGRSRRRRSTSSSRCSGFRSTSRRGGSGSIRRSIRCGAIRGSSG